MRSTRLGLRIGVGAVVVAVWTGGLVIAAAPATAAALTGVSAVVAGDNHSSSV